MTRIWPYVLALDAVALVVFWYSLQGPTIHFPWVLLAAAIFTITEMHPLNINDDGDLSVGLSVRIAALLFFGLQATLTSVVMGELAYGVINRRPMIKTFFNTGQTVLSTALPYYIFTGLGGIPGSLTVHAFTLPLSYIFINTLLVSWILALSQRQGLWRTWVILNKDTLAYSIILGIGGLSFGGLLLSYDWLGLVLVGVLVVCLRAVLYQASFNLRIMKDRYLQTVRVLITALEHRDPYTYGHSSRVAVWCRKIAVEMGLPPEEVAVIELGGLVHDVGKVGVPDMILNKPDRLTQEEFDRIKEHTIIGERILLAMEGMAEVALMARQHHLYYTSGGRSYPDELPGREAYVGSRILSVADAWDAMTSDRPYRDAFTPEQAVAELKANKGIQFDPVVIDAFLRVIHREGLVQEGTAGHAGQGRKNTACQQVC